MEKNKIIAVAVVVVLVAVVAAAAVVAMGGDETKFNIVGRVNSEGSGIYLKSGEDVNDYVTDNLEDADAVLGTVGLIKEGWAGKVIGDPGTATIQHVQLGEIAIALGLGFKPYDAGEETSIDNLYYLAGVASYAKFEADLMNFPEMVGAFIWEAQLAIAEQNGCTVLAITNDLFPGHACCIIGANQSYMEKNRENTVRFLAAYVASVDKLNGVIKAGEGEGYDEAMGIAKDYLKASLTGLTDEQQTAAISSAWQRVTYLYADDAETGSLSGLTAEVGLLAKNLYEYESVKKTAEDLGFKSYGDLAKSFVDDSYMVDAVKYNPADGDSSEVKITLAVISGDIHQFAIHYGMKTGIFDQYNVKITLSEQTAGPGVYTALANGDAQFGFLGAPPMTINSINNNTVGSHNVFE